MKPIEAKYIYRLLRHKYPFLLIDRVVKLDPGKSAVGIKNVTINEPYFTGHFPGEPIVPGVLIVESLAQLTAVMYCTGAFPEDTNWDDMDSLDIDYAAIQGLRLEAREKLSRLRPRSLGQAGRVSGVSPADIAVLMVYLGK